MCTEYYEPFNREKISIDIFLLVYGLSIPLWVIEAKIDVDRLPLDFSVTDILTAFTPLIAVSILVYKEHGRAGVKKLFGRIFDGYRINRKVWYVLIALLPILLYFLHLPDHLFRGITPSGRWIIPFGYIPGLSPLFFLGAVVEETGCIGYAIDPMQELFGALRASVLIGLLWVVWHYPSIIQQGHGGTWIAWGMLGTVAVRILIVWLYNNTQKSLFACILFHTMMNLGRPLFPADQAHNPLVDYPFIGRALKMDI